jgi:hypothetical protein
MSDEELEKLRQQTERGSRLEESPSKGDAAFTEDVLKTIEQIDAGDRRKTIAVRDQPMAALLTALEEHPDRMQKVGNQLREALDRETADEFDRSEIFRLAVRVGIEEAAPEAMVDLREAHSKHAAQDL